MHNNCFNNSDNHDEYICDCGDEAEHKCFRCERVMCERHSTYLDEEFCCDYCHDDLFYFPKLKPLVAPVYKFDITAHTKEAA